MLKSLESGVTLVDEARRAIEALLKRIPAIQFDIIEPEPVIEDWRFDLCVRLRAFGRTQELVIEVKHSGQPRFARMAALQLRHYLARLDKSNAIPVFVAPYISEESRRVCDEFEIGFVDLIGNAHLQFDGVYIDRFVAEKPRLERRSLRSIFSPKAARVLRVMLRDPLHEWRVTELAAAARVSLGHISNVRKALFDREWAEEFTGGIALTNPNPLLDAWRENYSRPSGQRTTGYIHFHGEAFERVLPNTLNAQPDHGRAILASFSAARWLAPYGRSSTNYFYADDLGADRLREVLQLSSAEKGENVVILVVKDDGIFLDSKEPAPGIVCTSEVQTYLDLSIAGDRGREAADFLREETLQWPR